MRTIDWSTRLAPGEQLRWSGAPRPGFRFRLIDIPLCAFGTAFAVVGGTIAISVFPFGLLIPHFWIGLYFAFGRFIVDRTIRESSGYAIADGRAVIVRTWPSSKTTTVNLATVVGIEVSDHRDGTGTIVFQRPQGDRAWYRSTGRRRSITELGRTEGPAFEYIDHPHEVLALLRQASGTPTPPVPTTWPVTYGRPPEAFNDGAAALETLPPPPPPAPIPVAPAPAPPPVPAPIPVAAAPAPPPLPAAAPDEPESDPPPGPFWRPPEP